MSMVWLPTCLKVTNESLIWNVSVLTGVEPQTQTTPRSAKGRASLTSGRSGSGVWKLRTYFLLWNRVARVHTHGSPRASRRLVEVTRGDHLLTIPHCLVDEIATRKSSISGVSTWRLSTNSERKNYWLDLLFGSGYISWLSHPRLHESPAF